MGVRFFSEQTPFRYRGKRLAAGWIAGIIANQYRLQTGEIAVIFCPDDYLLQINIQYLRHRHYTDVITFNYSQPPVISGDVFVSVDCVRRNAGQYGDTFEGELHRVMAHGILHLCGLNDHTPRQQRQMRQAEDQCLAAFKSLSAPAP